MYSVSYNMKQRAFTCLDPDVQWFFFGGVVSRDGLELGRIIGASA